MNPFSIACSFVILYILHDSGIRSDNFIWLPAINGIVFIVFSNSSCVMTFDDTKTCNTSSIGVLSGF